jgi:hypothetical protein
LGLISVGGTARAELSFEIEYIDEPGEGFNDQSLQSPAEGNSALTLGAQRRAAFERALEIWSEALDSSVPVRVTAAFSASDELPCTDQGAVLGSANPASALRGFDGAPRADHFYPSALADRLAGSDLEPGSPDIIAQFNPRLDDDDCLPGIEWDYSITHAAGKTSFLNTALHEMAHGLGFTNLVDAATGSPSPGFGPFDALLYDATLGRYWDRMSSDERAVSARNDGRLLWAGSAVAADAASVLAPGAPLLEIDDGQRRLITSVAELAADPRVSEAQVQGPLRTYSDEAGCAASDIPGAIVLLRESMSCPSLSVQLVEAERAGAIGAVVRSLLDTQPPTPPPITGYVAALPTLVVTQEDYEELLDALGSSESPVVSLRADPETRLGLADNGWVKMNATDPVTGGSSVAHWDASVRRARTAYGEPIGLLMEPVVTDLVANEVDELTTQLLLDLGWVRSVCGDGDLDPGEVCDDGGRNDDSEPDACRSDCRLAHCGDGVVDTDELCDDGQALGDCPRDCGRSIAQQLPPAWDGSPIAPIEDLEGEPIADDAGGDDVNSDDVVADDGPVSDEGPDAGTSDDDDSGQDDPAPDDSDVDDAVEDEPEAGGDSDDAALDDAGSSATDDDEGSDGEPGSDAGADDTSTDDSRADAGGDGGAGSAGAGGASGGGCGCLLVGHQGSGRLPWLVALVLGLALRRRRFV